MPRMFGLFLRDLYPQGRCLAIKKNGVPCKIRGEVFKCKNGKLRCKFHGGLSTGARTPEGKEKANRVRREGWERNRERIMQALQQGRKRWLERRRAEKLEGKTDARVRFRSLHEALRESTGYKASKATRPSDLTRNATGYSSRENLLARMESELDENSRLIAEKMKQMKAENTQEAEQLPEQLAPPVLSS